MLLAAYLYISSQHVQVDSIGELVMQGIFLRQDSLFAPLAFFTLQLLGKSIACAMMRGFFMLMRQENIPLTCQIIQIKMVEYIYKENWQMAVSTVPCWMHRISEFVFLATGHHHQEAGRQGTDQPEAGAQVMLPGESHMTPGDLETHGETDPTLLAGKLPLVL